MSLPLNVEHHIEGIMKNAGLAENNEQDQRMHNFGMRSFVHPTKVLIRQLKYDLFLIEKFRQIICYFKHRQINTIKFQFEFRDTAKIILSTIKIFGWAAR